MKKASSFWWLSGSLHRKQTSKRSLETSTPAKSGAVVFVVVVGSKSLLLLCCWRPFLADTGSPRLLRTKWPRQLFGLSLLVVNGRARRPSDFFAVLLMDQGRGRSVAPTRPILRPQTRYKGRGC